MSSKDFGCFYCTGKAATSDGICNRCGKSVDITNKLLGQNLMGYKTVSVIGRGFNGWTIKVDEGYQFFAMKIIPAHRLKRGEMEDNEARALAACAPHRNIARFIRPLRTSLQVDGASVSIFCLVFEYIEGAQPLSRLLTQDAPDLEKRDVAGILIGICSGLARMHTNHLWHDDLHDGNILIRSVGPDENLNERYEAKLIDFGSTKPLLANEQEPTRSDYKYLSKHIFNLVLAFELANQDHLAPPDRAFAGRLRRLAHRLSDSNVSRRDFQPNSIVAEIRSCLEESTTGTISPHS